MSEPVRVLLVEDEPAIADAVAWSLEREGFAVQRAGGVAEGLARLDAGIQLVILDVGLPDGSGLDACREIRRRSDIPVIFLSARGSETDRVVGLEIGGDDYVVKPFSPRELVARVRARLRQTGAPRSEIRPLAWKPCAGTAFERDDDALRFRLRGRDLSLTPAETRILQALLERPGRVFSRAELLSRALGEDSPSLERTVDSHVKSLRSKLREAVPEADPIETRRGFGYAARREP